MVIAVSYFFINTEKQLIDSINFKSLCGDNWKLIESLYYAKLHSVSPFLMRYTGYLITITKYENSDSFEKSIDTLTAKYGLGSNQDVLIPQAEKKYMLFDYKSCMQITKTY